MRWSQDKAGTWNGKIGQVTLMTVAYLATRGWFVSPKLPGLKTVDVTDPGAGRDLAQRLWCNWYSSVGLRRVRDH